MVGKNRKKEAIIFLCSLLFTLFDLSLFSLPIFAIFATNFKLTKVRSRLSEVGSVKVSGLVSSGVRLVQVVWVSQIRSSQSRQSTHVQRGSIFSEKSKKGSEITNMYSTFSANFCALLTVDFLLINLCLPPLYMCASVSV